MSNVQDRIEYRDHVFENPHAEMSTIYAHEYTYTCCRCGEMGYFHLVEPTGTAFSIPVDWCLGTRNKALHRVVQEHQKCPTCGKP